jgi:DNA polymerase epsilon subunit 1
LGDEILRSDGGLNVKFIISKNPMNEKVASRAIPTAIFEAEPAVMQKFIRKWLKDSQLKNFDLKSIIDWDYYKERLGGTIQKIVTIPAAL